jgi:hypothetical protein
MWLATSLLMLISALLAVAHTTQGQGTTVRLEVPSKEPEAGAEPFDVTVLVDSVTNLGAFEFELTYDGDGCADWIEIADVNGDRYAGILDVVQVAQSALGGEVTTEPDRTTLDINKDRSLNILDVQVEAKNSDLVKAHAKCPSDTER